ncbi:hypothetical protein IWQ56_002191 [Coemansia nantahalensis]|uniref:Uncharacterized protein n=1 Tax=Coemansia nantahalensis TaxID=2789366 RepID=A0ACC1JZF2_9FUNG|nr:hypothetical protein IWQ56_002191 [Coemansia nantahalensis]KAJ2770538.1 hypothetical protein IWQ57_002618 [Coemansia nantahalensis]
MLVLLDVPGHGTRSYDVCNARPLADLVAQAAARLGATVPLSAAYIAGRNGLSADEALATDGLPWLAVRGRVLGGKGGFGSTLRSQGSRMAKSKPGDVDDCRDLYGRRLRTLKEAKSITEKVERDGAAREEAAERRRKKIADGLRERPAKKHRFDDTEYTQTCAEIAAATKDATRRSLREARKAKGAPEKRPELAPSSAADTPLVPLFDGELGSDTSDSDGSGSSSSK